MTHQERGTDIELSTDELVQVTLAITRTLRVAEGRFEATLEAVVGTATRMTGHDAGVALVENGVLTPAATTSRVPHDLDVLQAQLGAGPCLDAAGTQTVVRVDDTAGDPRWPPLGERAAELGVTSMICAPLYVDERVLGTLSLYATRPGGFSGADLQTAEVCAALAAAAIADARRGEQLRDALTRRDLIGQAKGILMERHRLTAQQAFGRLAEASQRLNRKLVVVAQHLVETGELLDPR